MIQEPSHGKRAVFISLFAALVLTVTPLPNLMTPYWPEWSALILLYWIMALPHRYGVFTAWTLGICLDVLKGALLGQHAMALAVIAFFMLQMHLRIRIYPLWQQSVMVGLMLLVYQALLLWIYDMTQSLNYGWSYWAPAIIGALLWPWVYVVLRDVRHRYRVS